MAKELKRRKEEIAALQRRHQEMEQTHMSSAAQLGDALASLQRERDAARSETRSAQQQLQAQVANLEQLSTTLQHELDLRLSELSAAKSAAETAGRDAADARRAAADAKEAADDKERNFSRTYTSERQRLQTEFDAARLRR